MKRLMTDSYAMHSKMFSVGMCALDKLHTEGLPLTNVETF